MNCRQFRKRSVGLLDVGPDLGARADLEEHLADCQSCAREFHELSQTLELLRPAHRATARPEFKESVMNTIETRLE